MSTITIPKKITKGEELVVIPRKEYERFLRILKAKKKTRTQLDRELDKALEDVKMGRMSKPFNSAEELIKSLQAKK